MAKKTQGNKKLSQAQKKAQLEEQNRREAAEQEEEARMQALVDDANAVKDVLAPFPAFKRCKRAAANLDLSLTFVRSGKDLAGDVLEWAFDLCKDNMEDLYNATEDMKWDSKIKRAELADAASRYIILSKKDPPGGVLAAADCCGFIHLRFEVEEEEPVLYVYELQLDGSVQRAGVGKFLMSVVELVAWKNDMDKVMLTVQKTNAGASKFYRRLGYGPDDCDPALCDPDEDYGYEILSKLQPRKKKPAAIKRMEAKAEEEEEEDSEDEDSEDEDEDEEVEVDGGATAAIGNMIRDMMETEGPVVMAVILEADGRVLQQELDMSPKKNTAGDVLGGGGTFLGQWEMGEEAGEAGEGAEGEAGQADNEDDMSDDIPEGSGSVVLAMMRRDQAGLPANTHTLPAPLHDLEEVVHGRILLLRMDENASPEPFTIADYEALKAKQAEAA